MSDYKQVAALMTERTFTAADYERAARNQALPRIDFVPEPSGSSCRVSSPNEEAGVLCAMLLQAAADRERLEKTDFEDLFAHWLCDLDYMNESTGQLAYSLASRLSAMLKGTT